MTQQSFPGPGHVYDVIIVGAGITGTEAALSCAKAGLDVLLVTTSLDTIYNLLGDGVVLQPKAGTFMAEAFTRLADEQGFVRNWSMHRAGKYEVEHTQGIHFLQSSVSSLLVENGCVKGVNTWEGVSRFAKATALCVGSFLKARLSIGELTETAGRLSEMSYDDLFLDLEKQGFVFKELTLEARFEDESLPYTVSCKVFAPDELEPQSFRLKRLEGLYGAGLCASGVLSYEEAALQGQELANSLLSHL
ncbi:MAG: FAD-dependent oxidoreductase [Trueperaceae bacterium]|nr:FAD-dependent oxidoreductase [Trueperaceae bacterium]